IGGYNPMHDSIGEYAAEQASRPRGGSLAAAHDRASVPSGFFVGLRLSSGHVFQESVHVGSVYILHEAGAEERDDVPVDPAPVGQKCRWLLRLTLLAEYQPMIRIREVSLAEFRDSDCLS